MNKENVLEFPRETIPNLAYNVNFLQQIINPVKNNV